MTENAPLRSGMLFDVMKVDDVVGADTEATAPFPYCLIIIEDLAWQGRLSVFYPFAACCSTVRKELLEK